MVVSADNVSIKRWSSQEVINKKEILAVQFTAKDVQLTASDGTRKLAQFTHKRKAFVAALKVNAPQLAPFLDSELQKGEQLRLQEIKDGLIIAIVVIGIDWPILMAVAYSLSVPSWVTLIFLCVPIPGLLVLYWFHRHVNHQLHTLPRFQ
ncbi:MAG: hypothetical protein ACE5R6_05025 [Candidatus Heimdallarchaeota archaeon]